jgi:hypothetical protein
MKGFDFKAYLRNYEILQVIGANKTRKQFKNFLRVLYGKKKDRGYIKKKIEKYIQEQKANRAKLYSTTSKVMPSIGMINGPYGWL